MTKFLGITDERTACDCCGKSGLKRTVALDFDGDVRYYGVDCAARALYGNNRKGSTSRVINQALAVSSARLWLATYSDMPDFADKVAQRVWNRFGYATEVRNGALNISDFASIPVAA